MRIRNFSDAKSIFFDNLTVKQTVFKNTLWLAVAAGVNRFLTFFLFIYVARILGPTEYGKFTFALAFIFLFSIFSDLGLSRIITRELSREKEKEKEFSVLLSLKLLLISGALIAVLIGSFIITSDLIIRKIIWILAGYVIIGSFAKIIYSFFQARQKMEYEALARIFQTIIYTGFGFFVIFNFPSAINLAYGCLIAVLIYLFFLLLFFHFKIYPLYFNWNKLIWKKYLSMSWPLVFAGLFATIYSQIDTVMMGHLGQITQTGWYNAAYRIVGVTLIPMGLISTSFFPVLSKSFKESKEELQALWNYQMTIMIFLAFPIIVGGVVLAPKIIDFIYDQSYFPSIFAFQILVVMAGTIFLYNAFQQGLVVANQQKKIFWVVLLGAIINIILNLILIPKFSLYGAAISTVITNLLILFLLIKFILKFTAINPFNLKILTEFIIAIICSMIMYFVISSSLIYSLNVILTILVGGGFYLICFLIINKILYDKKK